MTSLDNVIRTKLRVITDTRGSVMHMLRSTDAHFQAFGEIYFSTVNPGTVKGWIRHSRMTVNLAVPAGRMRIAVFDEAAGDTWEFILGPGDDYALLTIPPGLWYGFRCEDTETALLANCASMPHDPEEASRRDPFDPSIPYDWKLPHG